MKRLLCCKCDVRAVLETYFGYQEVHVIESSNSKSGGNELRILEIIACNGMYLSNEDCLP